MNIKINKQALLWCVVGVLGVATAFNYVRYQQLKEAYNSQAPIVIMDWSEAFNSQNSEEKDAIFNKAQALVKKLQKQGYIVLDGRYVNAAPKTSIITPSKVNINTPVNK